jgi:putative PEP-CTERM system histidine kinase
VKLVIQFGDVGAFPLKALFLLIATALLIVLLNSDRLHQRIHALVSTHFQRPHYDYRRVWSEFNQRTTTRSDSLGYCRESIAFLADTFEALSVSVWLHRQERGTLVLCGTLNGTDDIKERRSATESEKILRGLRGCSGPVDLDAMGEDWADNLRALCPSKFEHGGHRYAVPLKPLGEVTGVLLIGDRVNGVPFTTDDFELLGVIAGSIGSDLLNLELSEKMVENREMQAFQNLSTFFIHDLKNTASTLSLLLRNLHEHFDDPAFREDALRSFGRCVETIDQLIERLTLLRQGDRPDPVIVDLSQIVQEALASTPDVSFKHCSPTPCLVKADPQLLHTIVSNLVVNAREAGGEGVQVEVETNIYGSWAVLTVQDNGCGMSPEFLENQLFRPFKTTKKGGLGIGLFHTRNIVDEHRGRIEVESEVAQGTTFRVMLPLIGEVV